jgi:16S rRNA (cytosine967-C5)-methyltransferase
VARTVTKKASPLSARAAAYLALRQIEMEDAYANIALKQVLNQYQLPANEARLATQIVYGATRMQLALDHILSQFLAKPLSQLPVETKIILRLSLYQVHYLRIEPYAAVNEGVLLAKKYAPPKLSGLVNGVLRNYLRAEEREKLLPSAADGMAAYLQTTLSFPEWIVEYLLSRYTPEQAEAFCLHANSYRGVAIRANTLKTSRDELYARLAERQVEVKIAGYAPESLLLAAEVGNLAAQPLFREGYFIVQGLSSQLVAHALNPAPGSRVLDLCAAPGGKTTHLAALMKNKGELHAFDVHPHKTSLVRDNAERLGCRIIQAETADSRFLPESYLGWADYLLLDAPCTGLGTLGLRADSRFRRETADIAALAELSGELLEAAARYLKPGGRLCYATCTITEAENGGNIRRFLEAHPEFALVPIEGLMPYLPGRRAELERGELQLLPFQDSQAMEGFYIALLEKSS